MKKYIPIFLIISIAGVLLTISAKQNNKEQVFVPIESLENTTIAAYVNGVPTDEMPNDNSNLFGYVKCYDNSGNELDTLGFVNYVNDEWKVSVNNITTNSACNVYFIDPPAHWATAGTDTLLKAIKDNNPVVNTQTLPGKEINLIDEAELSGTIDDYGTSYYFRGNVQNNYVQFAGMCWRIVRVDGNGNIKLILWNKGGIDCTISSAQGKAFNNGTYTKEGSDYNVQSTASGVGFMYGKPDSKQIDVYAAGGAQENKYDSSMLTYLKGWYENTFNVKDNTLTSNYTEMLADVIWCGDKSFYEGPGYAEKDDTDKINTYFNAYNRLINNPKSPSLVCPSTSIVAGEKVNIGNISKYTAADTTNGNGLLKKEVGKDANDKPIYKYYKVGLITADEVAFAGGAYNKANSTYYLYTGLNSHFWTMSPFRFDGNYALVWIVYSVGSLVNSHVHYGGGARPSIALNYDVQATYDDSDLENKPAGSVNNPYVITVPGE